MKILPLLASVLAACSFLPNRQIDKSKKPEDLGYNYNISAEIGPFLVNAPLDIKFHMYSFDLREFQVNITLKVGTKETRFDRQYYQFTSPEKDASFQIGGELMTLGTVKLYIDAGVYDEGPYHRFELFCRYIDVTLFPSKKESVVEVKGNGETQTSGQYVICNYLGLGPSSETKRRTYCFYNAERYPSLSGRGLRLHEIVFTVDDPFCDEPMTGRAELRIQDHLLDFNIGTQTGAFKVIPLSLSKGMRDGEICYGLFNPEIFSYDRQTLSSFVRTDDCIYSNDIYCPLGLGHDDDEYRFQIYIELSNGDNLLLYRFLRPGKSIFGSCSNSQYCLIGDMNA